MAAPLSPEAFASELDVSRETMARLQTLAHLLQKWNERINLVSQASLNDLWRRHMLDSAQLRRLGPAHGPWLDLGSGAGFPGLVLAAMGAPTMHLVESDARKCVFLREATRAMAVDVTVHNCRIERLPAQSAAAITARALAPLPKLLALAAPHLAPGGVCLFPKGQDVEAELTEASKSWRMRAERIASLSDPRGVVLRLKELSHVGRPA